MQAIDSLMTLEKNCRVNQDANSLGKILVCIVNMVRVVRSTWCGVFIVPGEPGVACARGVVGGGESYLNCNLDNEHSCPGK